MATLTHLDEKLAEVLGLAQAATGVTTKVAKMLEEGSEHRKLLDQMGQEAEETARRAEEAAGQREGKKTAILEKARETKGEATEMMRTYLGDEDEALDGFEFLIMVEAGELGHWEILKTLNDQAGDPAVRELTEYVLPIQQRHFSQTREAALAIAGDEDPNEEA